MKQHEYELTITVQARGPLTEKQRESMAEECIKALDDHANLPLNVDLFNATIKEVG